jgi:hypothetical protein
MTSISAAIIEGAALEMEFIDKIGGNATTNFIVYQNPSAQIS